MTDMPVENAAPAARDASAAPAPRDRAAAIRAALGDRSIVLIGLMGAGKSTIGRKLAERLKLGFVDADHEIEHAAGMSIADIFAAHGEASFRDGERRVIARLLEEGGRVIATGGGAYMNAETRAAIAARGVSVWLKADLPVLMRRVRRRSNRPLLQTADPESVMRDLMAKRYPVYALADVAVLSSEAPHEAVACDVEDALLVFLDNGTPGARALAPANDGDDLA